MEGCYIAQVHIYNEVGSLCKPQFSYEGARFKSPYTSPKDMFISYVQNIK